MASEIKVNKISPESGTTLTLGDSGDTINFGTGVLPNFENLTVTGDLTVDTNSLKVDSTNNFVGIGTASPSVALDVVGAITATGNITGTLATASQPNITSVGTLTGLTVSGNIAGTLTTAAQPNITSVGTLTGLTSTGIDDNATSVAITIDSNENVGIGTTSPNNYSGYGNLTLNGTSGGIFDLEVNGTRTASLLGLVGETRLASITNIPVTFQVNNAEKMRLNSTGLGIGTSNPTGILECSSLGNTQVYITAGNSSASELFFGDAADVDVGKVTYLHASNSMKFQTNTTEKMRITSDGNVGIGTASPDTLLSLEKNNAPVIQFKDTSGATDEKIWRVNGLNDAYRIQTWNDALNSNQVAYQILRSGVDVQTHRFYTEDSERMRLTTTGLGIGTSSPSAKVHSNTSSNGATTPIILSNYDTTAGTNQKNRLDFGLARNSGALKTNAGRIEVGREQDWTSADNNIDSYMAFSTYLNNASTEHMRIDSSGNFMVGTTSASGFDSAGLPLIVGSGSTHQGITIFSGTSHQGAIHFADGTGTSSYRGQLNYKHDADAMTFATSGSEKARLDANGSLFISKTNNTIADDGHAFTNSFASHTVSNNPPLYLNRKSSDGTIIGFRKDDTTVGNIGALNNDLYICSSASGHTGLSFANINRIFATNNSGTPTDNVADLGASDTRFANLYLGGGLYVGGTGSANKLDDYEEGTWTPDLQDSSGNSATMASSATNFGLYRKVGSQVFITARIEATSIAGLTGGETVRIYGLPFTGPNQRSTLNFNFFDFNVPSGFTMVMGYIDGSSSYFQCRKEGTSSGGGLTVTQFGANKGLGASGTYVTD